MSGAAWKFQEGGVKKIIFQENFSPKYSFPGVFCQKNGNSRGGSLTHRWNFQGSSIPPVQFKIAISQFAGGYNSLFNSLLIFCFFIAVQHFDGPKRKICFLWERPRCWSPFVTKSAHQNLAKSGQLWQKTSIPIQILQECQETRGLFESVLTSTLKISKLNWLKRRKPLG